ncbi:MAG: DNA polymerase [Oscillospiraceae bacterium]|nr:DNA polymerase [Oscillospiraceae bacterium]
MKTLSIDLETRSGADISKCGVYRYAEDPDFDILLFGVSVDGAEPLVYDVAGGQLPPEEILEALNDGRVLKWAYNAGFERICLSRWLNRIKPELVPGYHGLPFLDPAGWRCSMVLSAYNGLPPGLAMTGAVLGLEKQKLSEGKELIRKFCVPTMTKEAEGNDSQQTLFAERRFTRPADAPLEWERFLAYNRRDVDAELQIQEKLKNFPVPDRVWEEYALDQEINDRGIRIDTDFVQQAVKMDAGARAKLTRCMRDLTGLENPNSVLQLKEWLQGRGLKADSLGKKEAKALMKETDDPLVQEVLSLRLQVAKSSVRKYEAMLNCVCSVGRCRGMFQFYGASRSGRWAGRMVQLQNLPQNRLPDLDVARALVKAGDEETVALLYGEVPAVLSELVRTAFVPENGKKFTVADFSAIEARVLAHLAGERWRERVFDEGGDIYAASASKMFGVPVVKHGINGELRQKGKIAELALGYGGSTGALKSMGALEMGVPEEELDELVSSWREANPKIVKFWWDVDRAAKQAVTERMTAVAGPLTFEYKNQMLRITLPSGRELCYLRARIEEGRYGSEVITYDGLDAARHWNRIETYGPKLTENIVQAISRDLLADAMKRLWRYPIVGHVHDEVIIESGDAEEICRLMSRTPDWLPGLKLRADGYTCRTYRKE